MKLQKFVSKIATQKNTYVAALVMGAAILFSACENNNLEKIRAFESTENLPVQEAYNFETFYTDSGQVRFTLKAPKLLRFENDGQTYLEFPNGIDLVKYDENKHIISSIQADYAKQYVKEQKWEAKNNVVVTNAQGDTLKTEHLIWEEKGQRIYTDEFVKIIRADQIITGTGLESDQNMTNWKIKKPKGSIYVAVKKPGQLSDSSATTNAAVSGPIPPNQP